jgi:hypothetical protein
MFTPTVARSQVQIGGQEFSELQPFSFVSTPHTPYPNSGIMDDSFENCCDY